ncbi:alpha-N-arabinofuranosidase [Novosphingobium humi]|uniref:non-reducing end alpha-L-arabinofuranosidase n=1 Tax=Novosphingobium humi TaxID=2282397 RepID=A0ABY7TWY4_9SPHN|nr:alpha-L-arabinofuranosidase C-terminal domain-containing protein [Novosphingobium humi]WCT77773.1 alpha-L-arabinofuranosidase C-terminal domain-containing protein [Novosphingobium humi]
MRRIVSLMGTAAVVFATPATAQETINGAIRADQPGPVISRHIQGQFAEHLGRDIYDGIWVGPNSPIPNTRGIRRDVVDALRAIKVPVVRWPGGCFADIYNWRDGIGPSARRPVRKNDWWGGLETNAFGTHEFFDFAEQLNTDTYVAINMATATPAVMREWMDYLTSKGEDTLAQERRANGHAAPFKVDFVGIGNEAWGCGGAQTPEYFANEYRKFATFFHKNGSTFHMHNDNSALRVASGPNNDDTRWMEVVLNNAGAQMDAISLHYYTVWHGDWAQRDTAMATGFPASHWNEILYQASRMDAILRGHEAVMDKVDPKKRIGLFVDEWGTWYRTEPGTEPGHLYQQNTLRDALVAAITFNIFHAHADRVRMANIAQAVNVLQAMLLTDGNKLAKTPTYYTFAMYTPFQDATFIPVNAPAPMLKAESGSFPAFTVSAAKARDGKTYVAIANADKDKGYRLALDLGGRKGTRVSGQVLTAAKLDAHNTPGQKEEIAPAPFNSGRISGGKLLLDIPAKSVVVAKIEG